MYLRHATVQYCWYPLLYITGVSHFAFEPDRNRWLKPFLCVLIASVLLYYSLVCIQFSLFSSPLFSILLLFLICFLSSSLGCSLAVHARLSRLSALDRALGPRPSMTLLLTAPLLPRSLPPATSFRLPLFPHWFSLVRSCSLPSRTFLPLLHGLAPRPTCLSHFLRLVPTALFAFLGTFKY